MFRLVVTVESPNGPAVRGVDNRLARPFASYDTEAEALQAVEELAAELRDRCAYCGDPMNVIIRGHHHTENGVDVTRAGGPARAAAMQSWTAEIWTTTVETVTTPRGPRYRGICYVGEGMPKNGPAPRGAQVRYTTRLHTRYNEAREQARSRTIHHNVFHDGAAGPDVMQHHRGIRCGEQVAA